MRAYIQEYGIKFGLSKWSRRGLSVCKVSARDEAVASISAGAALLTALNHRKVGVMMLLSGIATAWWCDHKQNRHGKQEPWSHKKKQDTEKKMIKTQRAFKSQKATKRIRAGQKDLKNMLISTPKPKLSIFGTQSPEGFSIRGHP